MDEVTKVTEVEAVALDRGWSPDGELGAKAWLDKGGKIDKGLKNHRDELKVTVETQGKQIDQLLASNKEFGDQQRQIRDIDRQKSQETIAGLRKELATAVSESDGAKFTQINEEISQHESNLRPDPVRQELDQNAIDWQQGNSWYGTDPVLTDYANGISKRVQALGYTGKAYFDEITRIVKRDMPDKFENKARSGSNGVESGGAPGADLGNSQEQTYKNLPEDGQTACDKYVKNGLGSKEDYCADYAW